MRVVVAEDAVLLREGIVRLLTENAMEVVGQAGDAEDLLRKVRAHKPDVAIVDIRMPPGDEDDGLQAAKVIRAEMPDTGVLVLSQYAEDHYPMELLSDGADGVGYLLKDRVADVSGFVAGGRGGGGGGGGGPPVLVWGWAGPPPPHDPLAELTPREREVLELMAQGLSNKGICEKLVLSERAVERHITGVLTKLGIPATGQEHRRVLAVLAYLGG